MVTGIAHALLGVAWVRHMQHRKQWDATPVPQRPVADRGVYALCAQMSVVRFVHTASGDGSSADSPTYLPLARCPSTKSDFGPCSLGLGLPDM